MFRRISIALAAILFLALAVSVGYALSELSGPETIIEEAQEAVGDGRFIEAIRLLDLAEDSLRHSNRPDLAHSVLHLRYRTYLQQNNRKPALRDLSRLITFHAPDDIKLEKERIRILLADGQIREALSHARRLLEDAADDPLILELAGEACQAIYQEKLLKLSRSLDDYLSPLTKRKVIQALLPYLYRPSRDPRSRNAKEEFARILRKYASSALAADEFRLPLAEIQSDIAAALGYYRRSLAAGGKPVAAYQGLAFALMQAQRDDDVVALSEAYLRRFDHIYAITAATNAAKAHFDAHRYRAVDEIARRMLDNGKWQHRLSKGRLSSDVRHLLLVWARALHAQTDHVGLGHVAEMTGAMWAKIELYPEGQMVFGLMWDQAEEPERVDKEMRIYLAANSILNPRPTETDNYQTAAELRLKALTAMAAGPTKVLKLYEDWIAARASSPQPYLARSRYLASIGDGEGAFVDAKESFRLAGHDEQVLLNMADAADAAFASSERGARGLLDQCKNLQITRPRNIAHDALLIPLARLALDEGQYHTALDSSKRASQLYLWAREPRYLWAQSAIVLQRFEEALTALSALRYFHPNDSKAMDLTHRIRHLTGASVQDLLFDTALSQTLNPELTKFLLQRALEQEDLATARQLAAGAGTHFLNDPEIRLLVFDVQHALGNTEDARNLLLTILADPDLVNQNVSGEAALRYMLLQATTGEELSPKVTTRLIKFVGQKDTNTLTKVVTQLDALKRPDLAFALLEPVVTDPVHANSRGGKHYLMAGLLALQINRMAEARTYLTAAMSFTDGLGAAQQLAMLELREGQYSAASATYSTSAATSLADAALMIRLGQPQSARAWIQRWLAEHPTDLRARCLQLLVNRPENSPPEFADLVTHSQELLLETLMFSSVKPFATDGLTRARLLVQRHPGNRIARWLRAHAMAQAGLGKEATEQLSALINEEPEFLAALDELVRVATEIHHPMLESQELGQRIAAAVREHPEMASPRLHTTAARQTSRDLLKENQLHFAAAIMGKAWSHYPQESRPTPKDVEVLIASGHLGLAFDVLLAIQSVWPADRTKNYLEQFSQHARLIHASTSNPELQARIEKATRTHIDRHGHHGALVHFLLELDDARNGPLPQRRDEDAEARANQHRSLLDGHVDLFMSGKDRNAHILIGTLNRLANLNGIEPTLDRVNAVLQRDPSILPLWTERARLYEQLGQPEKAVTSLRWLLNYMIDPAILLEFARIATQSGVWTSTDETLLNRHLDGPSANSPHGHFVRGLIAYRGARYADAARLLEKAAAQRDGSHLWFGALANLTLPGNAHARTAQRLLSTLAKDYPNNSPSAIVGNLSTQLALSLNEASRPAN